MNETLFTVTRKIRRCKSCSAKCRDEMEAPIVGCESIMAPIPPTKIGKHVYVRECIRRVWFDRDYKPVQIWDPTKIRDGMSPEEFWSLMAEELRKARGEAEQNE